MRKILLAGVSCLGISLTPALAQENRAPEPQANGLEYPAPDQDVMDNALDSRDIRQLLDEEEQRDGQDAGGDDRRAQNAQGNDRQPFPPPDVSDDDLETWSEAARDRNDAADEDLFSEGEMIPQDFLSFQGPDAWEGEGANDVDGEDDFQDFQRRRALRTEDRRVSEEQGPASAWDGRYAGDSDGSFHAGDLRPDRQERRDRRAGDGDQRRADDRRPDRQTTAATNERDERTRNAGRNAFGVARNAMPQVEFRTYQAGFDRERRVFEFAGVHKDSGHRIEVDVLGNGRIEEIEEQIPLNAVPPRIRDLVADALNGMRVDRAERSIRRNLSVYYEFDGSSANGRPLSVEIRSDGDNFRIEERSRS